MKSNSMLKKYYPKEVELKEASNELAKEYSNRSEEKIEYDVEHPLVVDQNTKILDLEIYKDKYDECLTDIYKDRKMIRLTFEDEDFDYINKSRAEEENPYVLDIPTRLSLEEVEKYISECESEDEISNLAE